MNALTCTCNFIITSLTNRCPYKIWTIIIDFIHTLHHNLQVSNQFKQDTQAGRLINWQKDWDYKNFIVLNWYDISSFSFMWIKFDNYFNFWKNSSLTCICSSVVHYLYFYKFSDAPCVGFSSLVSSINSLHLFAQHDITYCCVRTCWCICF